jgi:Flp pilus assembly protein TadG
MQPLPLLWQNVPERKKLLGFRILDVKRKSHRGDSACLRSKGCLARIVRDFLRRQRGVTAVEFAIIAIPFFLLIMGIVEVGLIFWAGYELENATAAAARLVRTGQAQNGGYTVNQLRAALCQNVVILSDCNTKVKLSVQTFATFAGITVTSAVDQDGNLQTSFPYSPGGPSSIVLLTAFYEWPLTTPLTRTTLGNLGNGNYLLQTSFAFRNEPYPQI